MNGEEVVDVSKKFNEYNLPLDVIWLDIEVINILLI
jgi:alpha-glucosidase (family GH31 glycosyl hydrolase)